jgi:hypothetical protein
MENIEILAILENLRLRHPEYDHILRVASACVAVCFGYNCRADWTGECSRLGLVDYSNFASAEINYMRLLNKADSMLEDALEVSKC